MIRVEYHETIARPIEAVFEQLVDIQGYAQWMPSRGLFVSSSADDNGAVGAGTLYTDRTRLGTVRGEVQEFERPRRVVFHYEWRMLGLLAMEGWPAYSLESAGANATRVHHTGQAYLYGPFKLLEPLIQRIASGERRRTLLALKESLENSD